MTELSREILRDWQVRKTKEQKTRFIAFLQERLPGLRVEEGGLPRCRNLVLGDPERADVVFTAHYDTCARLPFPNFITPKNLVLYLLYQLLIMTPFFALAVLLSVLLIRLGVYAPLAIMLSWALVMAALLYVFLFGPANPHTVNDNTSGVLTLCELIGQLSEEERARCAFVFFDHEETGLFGSSFFASKHKAAMKDRLLINFDCVSDGDDLAFASSADKRAVITGPLGAFYPSDQVNFPCGVGVAAMQCSRLLGLYVSRIHTARDTVCDERNYFLPSRRRAALPAALPAAKRLTERQAQRYNEPADFLYAEMREMRTQEQINEIVRLLLAEYPEASCTLDYGKDYELLFSVRLAAQCTDERVNQITPALFARFPTLEAFAQADVEEVEKYVHSCGFYRAKARDIVACAQVLLEKHGGKVPGTMEELTALPGVGRKTANLILGDVFRAPGSVVVDTHCIRLSNRMGLVDDLKEPEKIERELRKVLPPERSSDFCHCLVLHGRAVCDARKPLCENCCVRHLCQHFSG